MATAFLMLGHQVAAKAFRDAAFLAVWPATALPTTWPTRNTEDGLLPVVSPTVRAAAVDPTGNLWVSFALPYTYVFAPDGDKIRTLQLRGAGILTPNSMAFGRNGQLLVAPGLYEFTP